MSAHRRPPTRNRLGRALVLGVGLLVAVTACNYTGDMNVQNYKGAYNMAPRPQPIADARDRQSRDRAPSVPVNPTPENYWGNPYRPVAMATPAEAMPAPAAQGTGQHPYVGVDVPNIDRTNPTENTRASVARGLTIYQNSCLPCHGATAQGNGIVGAWFTRVANKQPANLTSPQVQSLGDDHFYDVITQGFGAMPALTYELRPNEVWDVIHYVRTLRAP